MFSMKISLSELSPSDPTQKAVTCFQVLSETQFWDDSLKLTKEFPVKEKMGRNDAYKYQQQYFIILPNKTHDICCECNT